MSNYGEELAYWYLRLNGFFPITNFVLHSIKNTNQKPYNADTDILAIRPPNAGEEIREKKLMDDEKIVEGGEESKYIFVYCEVKTGKYKATDLFPKIREKYVLKRFGLQDVPDNGKSVVFKKILIANKKHNSIDEKVIFIELDYVISFIKERFREYKEDKYPSRMFFNSSLIQLLIHEEKKGGNDSIQ